MPPARWEEEEDDDDDDDSSSEESVQAPPIVVAPRKKFEDEEDSDDVADNWDEAEDSEAEREKAKAAATAKAKADAEAAANKKPKAQRIEEHREEARRRRLAADDATDSEEEDDTTRRARALKMEQDADLRHAEELLGNAGLGLKPRTGTNKALIIEDKSNPGQTIDLSTIPVFNPSTRSQFDGLSATLVPLLTASATKAHYSLWVQDFIKKICADLPSTEIKKAASGLTALSNEKLKDEKALDKTGKKSKAAKSKITLAAGRDVGRGVADTTSYDDGMGDDDFM